MQICVAMEFPVVSSEPDAVLNESSAALPANYTAAECADGISTMDEELLDFLGSQSLDSGIASASADPFISLSQASVSSSNCYSPEKKVIEKSWFITHFECTGANNRAGKKNFWLFSYLN